jgi:DNA-binding response OmpR family regulator
MSAKQKILVVDDEEDILEILKYNLEKEGFEVKTAGDGNALRWLKNLNHILLSSIS